MNELLSEMFLTWEGTEDLPEKPSAVIRYALDCMTNEGELLSFGLRTAGINFDNCHNRNKASALNFIQGGHADSAAQYFAGRDNTATERKILAALPANLNRAYPDQMGMEAFKRHMTDIANGLEAEGF